MCLQAAKAAEPAAAGSESTPIRELGASTVSDHDVLYFPAPVDENAHLAANIVADLGEVPRQIMGDQAVSTQLTAEESLKLLNLTGLEATGVAVDLDEKMLQRLGSAALGESDGALFALESAPGGR